MGSETRAHELLALALVLEALLVAAIAPAIGARREESGTSRPEKWAAGALGIAALAVVIGAAATHAGLASALLAQVFVALHAVLLAGVARAVARRRGAGAGLVAGLALGFFLFGAPYFTGDAIAALSRDAEERATGALLVLSPSLVLPGTFAQVDVLRSGTLYERFRPVQDVVWSYPTPLVALAVQALLAALALGAGKLLGRLPRRTPAAAAALALALVVFAPARADAQVFGGGDATGGTAEGDIGPMNTRVRLGYIVPFIDGNFKVTGYTPNFFPSRLDLNNDLHLTLQYAIPVFEVDIGWQGAGRVWAEYWEAYFTGDFLSQPFGGEVVFKNLVVPADEIGIVQYRFRTISLNGRLDIPILDFVTLQIIGTTRYVHWDTTVRVPKTGQKEVSTLDVIFPAIGPGLDVFILDKVYAYGSVEWLDISWGGGHQLVYHYREAHAGIRLELVETAHVGGEFYLLEVGLENSRHNYRQRILGPRIWVEVQF